MLCVVAVLLGGFVYANALHNPFAYDDYRTVVDNGSLETLASPGAILLYEITRPLTNASYAIDRAIWGASPFGFHLTNVVLHMVNVALLFVIAWILVGDRRAAGVSARPPIGDRAIVAFAAAALFAVHPLMTQAVGYISARPDVLSGTIFLVAFLTGRQWLRRGSAIWCGATLALWTAAILAKETAILLPIVLFWYDWFVSGRRLTVRRLGLYHVPMLSLVIAACAIRVAVFVRVEHAGRPPVAWRSLAQQPGAIWQYVSLLAAPAGQSIFHEVRPIHSLLDPWAIAATAALFALIVVALAIRRYGGLASFGVGWFLVLLVPSVALAAVDGSDSTAEHRVYLASCGAFLMVGSFVAWCDARFSHVSRRLRILGATAFCVILMSLGIRTVLRNVVWSDPVGLWMEAVDGTPGNWFPLSVLGETLHDAHRDSEAATAFRSALMLNPSEETGYFNLAISLANTGHQQEAVATLQELKKVAPASPLAPIGLGAVAMTGGDLEGARRQFLAVLREDPQNVPALQSLAILEERAEHFEEAAKRCEQLHRLMPQSASVADCVRRNRQRSLTRP